MSAQDPMLEQQNTEPEVVETKVIQWATLDALRAAAEAKRLHPTQVHTDEETGMSFEFRELTGSDMDKIANWAGGDEDKYGQILLETASVNPKLDLLIWEALGELGPMVRIGLLQFVKKQSRLNGPAEVEAAKNS
jgi:hypothetical protein